MEEARGISLGAAFNAKVSAYRINSRGLSKYALVWVRLVDQFKCSSLYNRSRRCANVYRRGFL